jgi:PAS domain S-box-containing protein
MMKESRTTPLNVTRVFLIIFFGFTIISALMSVWLWFDVKRDRQQDLAYATRIIKSYYELTFHQWELTLYGIGLRLTEITGPQAEEERLEYANNALRVYDELLAFGFADTTGQIITFTGSQPGDSLPNLMNSENSRRSFLLAKKSERLTIGEVYYFPNVDDWILPIRMPIRDEATGELLAVNTSAIQYSSLIDELNEFGFSGQYSIHLINNDFNSTQLYFPLEKQRFPDILQEKGEIYKDMEETVSKGDLYFFEADNQIEHSGVYGIRTSLPELNHDLILSVNKKLVWESFRNNFLIIVLVYFLFGLVGLFLYRYYKRSEQNYLSNLQSEKGNLQALFESTNSIIALFDTQLRLLEFNQAFSAYARMTDEFEPRKGMDVFSQIKHPEYAELFRKYMQRALGGEKFKKTVEYPGPNGPIFLLLSYCPIYRDKEIIGVSLYSEDITELKLSQSELKKLNQNLEKKVHERTEQLASKNVELEEVVENLKETQEQLVHAEKMASIGILASGIGHEVNNPLNVIKNGVYALGEHIEQQFKGPHESLKDYYDLIGEGINRVTNIVKSLSQFSKSNERLDERCDIHSIIDNCLTILNTKIRDRVEIERLYPDTPLEVIGNEGKLHQVFLNILANAEQAIPGKGTITIKTARQNGIVRVSIKDDGTGISEENLNRIGDPFFTTKNPGEGTGLGLFITYSIIQEHRGKIQVHSQTGEGTTFIIELKCGSP